MNARNILLLIYFVVLGSRAKNVGNKSRDKETKFLLLNLKEKNKNNEETDTDYSLSWNKVPGDPEIGMHLFAISVSN